MEQVWLVQGRRVSAAEVAFIGHWRQAHPSWNRTRLSRQLCEHWNWRNGAGRLKDMACRSLLLKLEERGLITLPPSAWRLSEWSAQSFGWRGAV